MFPRAFMFTSWELSIFAAHASSLSSMTSELTVTCKSESKSVSPVLAVVGFLGIAFVKIRYCPCDIKKDSILEAHSW